MRGAVQVAALKGLAQFPTWNVESAAPLMEKILPDTTFVTYGSAANIESGLVVWKNCPNGVPPLLSQTNDLLRSVIRRSACHSYYLGLTMCEVSPLPLLKRRNVPASEMLPAAREVAVFIKSIDKRAASQSPWRRENFYRADAFVVLEGQKIVLHYPNVPRADCVQIMQQLDGVVTAIGVEGHSPGWRYTVTPDIAAADCSAPVDQLNFWLK